MTLFKNIYRGKRVLVTGHTGFKGSWLSLWLKELGANVVGVSLTPDTSLSHWDLLKLNVADHRIDIRNSNSLSQVFVDSQPEIVFHLAAQPLVRRSYLEPLLTWSTNVIGTANVLEACRQTNSVRAVITVTTDKCYENQEWLWGYRENDRLGGHDPYSASKAAAELVAASYRNAYFKNDSKPLLATARSGNVIGGGDWSKDRLIPDLVHAIESKKSIEIRSPESTRPWQHVLESLSGYLLLGQNLLLGQTLFAEPWNFGPEPNGNCTVAEVLNKFNHFWTTMEWHRTHSPQPHEANLLYLDCTKARKLLNWQPVWDLDKTIEKTANWYSAWIESKEVISRQQLTDYISAAKVSHVNWVQP
jgi:CDP-glucose 4,6-dehydratase